MPTVLIVDHLAFSNASVRQDEGSTYQRIAVQGTTLRECVLNYGLATGKRIEAADQAPYFRVFEPSIDSDHWHFCCSVRRGPQVVRPTSFDYVLEESDEIEIELLIC